MSRMTSLILGLRSQAGGPRWLGTAMAVLIAITLVWAAWHTVPVIRTAQLPAPSAAANHSDEQRRAEFATALQKHQALVDGRSMFFVPPRPRPPRPTVVEDDTPREPVKPSRYGGPSMIAMVNGAVLFADGQRVKVGESGRGVKVVGVTPPWSARLEYQGVEFDVELFQRDSSVVRPASHSLTEPTQLTPSTDPVAPPAKTEPAGEAKPATTPPASGPSPTPEPQPEPEPEPQGEPEPSAAPSAPPESPDPAPSAPPAPPVPESP